jgi:hypothetical protein
MELDTGLIHQLSLNTTPFRPWRPSGFSEFLLSFLYLFSTLLSRNSL